MEEIKEIENLHSISEGDDTDRAPDLQEVEVKGNVLVEQHRPNVSITPELVPKEFKAFDKRISSAAVNPPNDLANNSKSESRRMDDGINSKEVGVNSIVELPKNLADVIQQVKPSTTDGTNNSHIAAQLLLANKKDRGDGEVINSSKEEFKPFNVKDY